MLQRILVAIDGSPQSHKALEVASEMAERFSSKMIVLHVLGEGEPCAELRQAVEAEHLVTPPSYTSIPEWFVHPGVIAAQDESARQDYFHKIFLAAGEQIVRRSKAFSEDKGVSEVMTVLAEGDPAEEILSYARDRAADMIVLGNRGLGGVERLFLGSVSEKVAREAGCHCLIVK